MSSSNNISKEKRKLIREAFTKMEGVQQPEALTSERFKQWLRKVEPIGSFVNKKFVKPENESQCQHVTVSGIRIQLPSDSIFDAAFEGAESSSTSWFERSIHERLDKLLLVAKTIEERRDLFVVAAASNGKTSNAIASGNIEFLIQCFHYFANLARVHKLAEKLKPIGVVVVISDDDSIKMFWHVCGALVFGNTVVFQVNPENCILPSLLGDVMEESGIPTGVFNALFMNEVNRTNKPLSNLYDCRWVKDFNNLKIYIDNIKVFFEVPRKSKETIPHVIGNCKYIFSSDLVVIIMEESDIDSAVFALLDSVKTHRKSSSIACVSIQESIIDKFHKTMQHHSKNSEFDENVACSVEGLITFSGSKCSSESLTEIELASREYRKRVRFNVFRSATEVIDFCNSGKYKSASIWCEKLSLALDLAKKVKASDVWINSMSNPAIFDFSNGSKNIVFNFMKPKTTDETPPLMSIDSLDSPEPSCELISKFYYGGILNDCLGDKYAAIRNKEGRCVLCISGSSLKDVSNAVSCAVAAKSKWEAVKPLDRTRMLYKISEKIEEISTTISEALQTVTGRSSNDCENEVISAVEKIKYWAAYCQLFKNNIQSSSDSDKIALNFSEPYGIVGIVCPNDSPFISFITLVVSAIALGNVVVVFASRSCPKPAFLACNAFQDCNMMPGVINVVYTIDQQSCFRHLLSHSEVTCAWIPRYPDTFFIDAVRLPYISKPIKYKHAFLYEYNRDEWYSTDSVITEELVFHATTNKIIRLPDNDIFP